MSSAANSDTTEPLTIREATADDAAVLSEMIAEFNGESFGGTAETAARLAACAGLEVALLACTPSKVIGFGCLRLTPAIGTPTPHALLTELYVREPYRKHGVGRALVARVEALALAQGATHLYLFTGDQNLTAQRFYAGNGYAIRGVTLYKPLAE
jgi:GNAT superfamily N-acetyltransferase